MTESKIELRCPKCSISIMVSSDQAGEKVDCPRCQNKLLVPGVKKAKSNPSFDDLIDIDDDDASSNTLAGDAIEAASFGGGSKSTGKDEEKKTPRKKQELSADDLPSDLQLAPEEDSVVPIEEAVADPEPLKPTKAMKKNVDEEDDLGDLLDIPETNEPIPTAMMNDEDPFDRDENANLVVEGVTPADGQFPVDCHLCGSLLYARVSQVGTQIKCHDCHSMIDVEAPKVEPTPIEAHEVSSNDDEGGYSLSDPVELEPIDHTFDTSLGEIDYNDDDYFEKRRQIHGEPMPDEVQKPRDDGVDLEVVEDEDASNEGGSEPFGDIETNDLQGLQDTADGQESDEYEMAPLAPSDTPKPTQSFVNEISESEMEDLISKEANNDEPAMSSTTDVESDSELDAPEKRDVKEKEPPRKPMSRKEKLELQQSKALQHYDDTNSLVNGIGEWAAGAVVPFKSPAFLIRLVLASMLVGCGYLVINYGLGIIEEAEKTATSFFGFISFAFGLVPLGLGAFCFATAANPIIQAAIHRDKELSEFPELSMGTFMGEALYIGSSFWAASVPGVILGALVAAANEHPFWILYFGIISALVLAPFFLASVMHNQSPWYLLSDKVFRAAQALKFRWMRFTGAALIIGLIFSSGLLLIRFGALGFVVAFFQFALLGFYYWILGDLIGFTLRRIEKDAEVA